MLRSEIFRNGLCLSAGFSTSISAAASRPFDEALGLKTGARPPFASHGYWLYLGIEPVVHLVRRPTGEAVWDSGTGNLDHVAWRAVMWKGPRQVLQALGLVFRGNRGAASSRSSSAIRIGSCWR